MKRRERRVKPRYHPNQLFHYEVEVGDKVEVCFGDTGASCVWSYPGVVEERAGQLGVVSDQVNYRWVPIDDFKGELAECYHWLEPQWERDGVAN